MVLLARLERVARGVSISAFLLIPLSFWKKRLVTWRKELFADQLQLESSFLEANPSVPFPFLYRVKASENQYFQASELVRIRFFQDIRRKG